MNRQVLLSGLLAAVTFLSVVPTASAAPQNIAVVDLQKVLQTSKAGQSAQKQFQSETQEAQDEVKSKREKLEKLQEELRAQQASLSDKARVEKQEKLIEMKKDLDRSVQDLQESLERKNQQLVSDILRGVRDVISDIGKKNSYSVILEKNAQNVLFTDSAIDITEEVIKSFDSKKS